MMYNGMNEVEGRKCLVETDFIHAFKIKGVKKERRL
jgi:hypothetical protein